MMLLPIRLFGDPILRKTSNKITVFDDNLKRFADNMIETMYEFNGVGLAGPQVGISKNIFIALETKRDEDDSSNRDEEQPETIEEKRKAWGVVKEHVVINPKFLDKQGEVFGLEGCLSIPGLHAENIKRAEFVKIEYQDTDGKKHILEAKDFFARIIQHEYDHLIGKLFFDRLNSQEKQAFLEENRQELVSFQKEAKAFLKELKTSPQNFKIS